MKSNIDLGRENNSGGESWGRLGGGGRYSYSGVKKFIRESSSFDHELKLLLMMEGPRETHGEGE